MNGIKFYWLPNYNINLTFIWPCIIIYFYSKHNQMHQRLKYILFGVTLYIFQKFFTPITWSSRLYIQIPVSVSQRPLTDNTLHSQQTNIHDPGGNRTHNLSRRTAADLRLRPRGYWDRRFHRFNKIISFIFNFVFPCIKV